jgi:hypothetical protein
MNPPPASPARYPEGRAIAFAMSTARQATLRLQNSARRWDRIPPPDSRAIAFAMSSDRRATLRAQYRPRRAHRVPPPERGRAGGGRCSIDSLSSKRRCCFSLQQQRRSQDGQRARMAARCCTDPLLSSPFQWEGPDPIVAVYSATQQCLATASGRAICDRPAPNRGRTGGRCSSEPPVARAVYLGSAARAFSSSDFADAEGARRSTDPLLSSPFQG